MARTPTDYRILDKDLGRISNGERAMAQSGRPVLRLGLALLFIGAIAVLGAQLFHDRTEIAMLVAGFAVAAYLALSLGANDVSNALGPAVGAGAIGLVKGLVLVAIMEILGAVLAGEAVTLTLFDGIVDLDQGANATSAGWMMTIALLSAGTWVSFATRINAPVSTTHSIVGAILGGGAALMGMQAVNWNALVMIAAGWVLSPLVGGAIAAGTLAILQTRVQNAPDRMAAGRRWLPVLIAIVAGVFLSSCALLFLGLSMQAGLAIGGLAAGLGWLVARRHIGRLLKSGKGMQAAQKQLFAVPLIATALIMGFAHGASDASNVAAPLMAILDAAASMDGEGVSAMTLVLPIAGCGIAVGILLFGGRLVHMMGSRITRLNPLRALCVTMATATTVLGFAVFGMPVSTTQVAVGGVFGVGFYREWHDRRNQRLRAPLPEEERRRRHLVRRSHLRTILFAWVITLPITAGMAAIGVWLTLG